MSTRLSASSGAQVRALAPSSAGEGFELRLAEGSPNATVRIFDVRGRLVRTMHEGPVAAGSTRFIWDRRTDTGERVAAGVYLIGAKAGRVRAQMKVVVGR